MKLLHALGLGPRFDRQRPPTPALQGTETKRWLILQQGPNPSSDYYIRPRVAESGLPTRWRHLEQDAPQAEDLAPGTAVIIVRYLSPRWAEALRTHRQQLARVIYFMDDDLLSPATWQGLPKKYRHKLATLCQRMYPAIQALSTDYWASTPALAARYPQQQMQIIEPQPLPEDHARPLTPIEPGKPLQIFYHGSAVHLDEIRWLRPVIAEVLERSPQAHFEIIGDQEINRLYRDLPRTRVLHPMSWPNDLAHCRSMKGHIGLAPLLPGAFNEARSHVKIFDIARCGASGLYANAAPYAGKAHAENCLPMEAQSWIDALIAHLSPPTSS